MMEKSFQILFSFTLLLICFACQIDKPTKPINDIQIDFCVLANSPQSYQNKTIQTTGIVLGYHTFIFYSDECLEQEQVLAMELNRESRTKIVKGIEANRKIYKTDFLNNNIYAEITVLGELGGNSEKKEAEVYYPKYRFSASEIKEVKVLSDEVYPNEKARGLKEVNIK